MISEDKTGLYRLVMGASDDSAANTLFKQLYIHPNLLRPVEDCVSRAEIAQALTMLLFNDLLSRVPDGRQYVLEKAASGAKVVLDHGALRTVACAYGRLPPGEAAIARILRPLGYSSAGTYPLRRLNMTGRAWAHEDLPESIAQFFVSELHPEMFSAAFQLAAHRIFASSQDPLGPQDLEKLEVLSRDRSLRWSDAHNLLPRLYASFGRHHGLFDLVDYVTCLDESPEMAWIATEGNAFNHATDRVGDIYSTSEAQRSLCRSIKDHIEVSQNGGVMQTAFRAANVRRKFLQGKEVVTREVPGSFYEFIQRTRLPSGQLDLSFDSGNATAIFKMTANDSAASRP